MNINDFTPGMNVRLGKGKVIWTVVAVRTEEQASMPYPAGVALRRPTGQHQMIGLHRLDDLTVVTTA